MPLTLEARLAQRSRPIADGCILWTGSTDRHGYGQIKVAGRVLRVHRVAYELYVAPIPAGLVIDHLCRVRACVNVEHMEPVTSRTNTQRGLNVRDVECRNGHPRTPENTSTAPGYRHCLTCQRDTQTKHQARRALAP